MFIFLINPENMTHAALIGISCYKTELTSFPSIGQALMIHGTTRDRSKYFHNGKRTFLVVQFAGRTHTISGQTGEHNRSIIANYEYHADVIVMPDQSSISIDNLCSSLTWSELAAIHVTLLPLSRTYISMFTRSNHRTCTAVQDTGGNVTCTMASSALNVTESLV